MQHKQDSIDNLLDSTTRQKYSKSYSEMPKDFRPHQRKKEVNMPERTECKELKEMQQSRLGRDHQKKDYKLHSDHISVAKQEPHFQQDIDFYKQLQTESKDD